MFSLKLHHTLVNHNKDIVSTALSSIPLNVNIDRKLISVILGSVRLIVFQNKNIWKKFIDAFNRTVFVVWVI